MTAKVVVDVGTQEIVSAITRASAERLGLAAGGAVVAIVKATDVLLGKSDGRRVAFSASARDRRGGWPP